MVQILLWCYTIQNQKKSPNEVSTSDTKSASCLCWGIRHQTSLQIPSRQMLICAPMYACKYKYITGHLFGHTETLQYYHSRPHTSTNPNLNDYLSLSFSFVQIPFLCKWNINATLSKSWVSALWYKNKFNSFQINSNKSSPIWDWWF